jgi:ribosomal protein L11 methyltransferase
MLDVGTGSGILAIAAIKMGAIHATGIDIDPWSIENAKENIVLNHVENSVEILLSQPADIKNHLYNLIASNITLNANIGFLKEYHNLLRDRGILLLSGFLDADLQEMKKHLQENGFLISRVVTENEWNAIGAVRVG